MVNAVAAEIRDGALILTLRNGPTNALNPDLCRALLSRLADLPPGCGRIVLTGAGAGFSSAVPLDPAASAGLAELCAAVEASPLPVIAALYGLALGPGAELALAARARIAAPGTRIAFPEVALGLCPAGGSTLRLPRLLGARAALDLLLTGRAVTAEAALDLGLVDAVSPDPLGAALAVMTLPARALQVAAEPGVIASVRRAETGALPAALRILACVEAAALLPPEAHRAFETVAREDLAATPEAAALRAVAEADRRAAALPPAVARERPAPVTRLALYGADPALASLAAAALERGLEVAWQHPDPWSELPALSAPGAVGRERLRALPPDTPDPAPLQIHSGVIPPRLRQPGPEVAHLVIGGAAGELGLSLAPLGLSCELAVPAEAAADAAAIALAVAGLRRLGWQPLIVGGRPGLGRDVAGAGQAALTWLAASGLAEAQLAAALAGFGVRPGSGPVAGKAAAPGPEAAAILPRWLAAQANAGLLLLDEGVARRPSDIDLALVAGHGFPRWQGGPMYQADRRGLMALRRDLRLWAAEDPLWSPAPLLDRLIRDGLTLAALNRQGWPSPAGSP
jgi:3-hydroxyacyl-CoA dehydrogenase